MFEPRVLPAGGVMPKETKEEVKKALEVLNNPKKYSNESNNDSESDKNNN